MLAFSSSQLYCSLQILANLLPEYQLIAYSVVHVAKEMTTAVCSKNNDIVSFTK